MPHGGFAEVRQESLSRLLTAISQELSARRAQTPSGELGWHNTFEPGKVGTTGSALPLRFLRSVGRVNGADERKIVSGLVGAQHVSGGWCILSIATTPTVEGTAPTLLALIEAGGVATERAIEHGTEWLRNAQNDDGGWASVQSSASRTCLTGSAVEALARVPYRAREALDHAITYFECAQNLDGGWGAMAEEPSTVVHTALGLRGLVNAGASADHQAVKRGLAYVDDNWIPNPIALQHEPYNVLVDANLGHHSKVFLTHDVDAEVVQALILARPVGLNSAMWDAVSGWAACSADAHWWVKLPDKPSLWTIVPRGMAIVQLHRALGKDWRVVRRRGDVVAFSGSAARRPLAALLWSLLTTWPVSARRLAVASLLLAAAILVVLAVSHVLDWSTVVMGGVWPLLLAVLINFATKPGERRG